ncbi:hypothetical protein DICSQDRAFT_133159 [Dichomitus squalens LYAD-421 SS1]|nr:uncharacterized protein DICSQDRAFT_133159 [Dichomitus squalens LYAD-421 SS1]EJF65553.1 hypothetical protein DICSQDRAFT_133159 [Dichomitus squalens LYAD-421 SS1]TBU24530.1 hypothetical protein BD311DRAFT_780976 [Dichomitus squalens]
MGPSASSPNVSSGERRRPKASQQALARAATEPAQGFEALSPATPRRPVHRPVALPLSRAPPPPPRLPVRRHEAQGAFSGPSTSSSPPTEVSQTKNRFTNSPGISTPRLAQSLSYASPQAGSPAGLRTPSSLASSDQRSHLSSPSSFGTRYFPEDFPARLLAELARSPVKEPSEVRVERQSLALSEYGTAPNTPELEYIDLEYVVQDEATEDAHEPAVPISSPAASPEQRRTTLKCSVSPPRDCTEPKMRPSTTLPAVTQVNSSPVATSTARLSAISNSVNSTTQPPAQSQRSRKTKPVAKTKSLSDAQVQTEPQPPVRRRRNQEAAVQAAPPPPPKMQRLDHGVQISRAASPTPATTGVGDIPVRAPIGAPACACEHPQYACLHCGRAPPQTRAEPSAVARASLSPLPDPFGLTTALSPSVLTTVTSPALSASFPPESSSPASFATPASAISSSVSIRSSRSPVGGHTPRMGPSEAHAHLRSTAVGIQQGLDMMSFSEATRGAHDVGLDPRSPIQRGTRIPIGYAVRSFCCCTRSEDTVLTPAFTGLLGLRCGRRLHSCQSR